MWGSFFLDRNRTPPRIFTKNVWESFSDFSLYYICDQLLLSTFSFLIETVMSFFLFDQKILYRITGAQLGGKRVGRPPLPFFENQKKCPDFAKKDPDCVHPQIRFTIQNVVLTVSKRKNSEIFLAGPSFLEFLTKCLSKCSNFAKPSLP